jgi:hypothetical protein
MMAKYAVSNTPEIDRSIPPPLRSFLVGTNQIHDGEPNVHPSRERLDSFVAALDDELGRWDSTRDVETRITERRIERRRSSLTSWMFGVMPTDFARTQAGEYKAYSSLAAVLVLSSVFTSVATAAAVRGVATVSWLIAWPMGILYGAMGMLFGRTLLLPRPVVRRARSGRRWIFLPMLLVRGVLSILMSATIGQGLMLAVFESEINATLAVQNEDRVNNAVEAELTIFNEQIAFTSSQISMLKPTVSAREQEVEKLQAMLYAEISGAGTSERVPGRGPMAQKLQEQLQTELSDFKEARDRLSGLEERRDALLMDAAPRTQKTREAIARRYAESQGLGSRLGALSEQRGSELLFFLILGLLVVVDLFPILARALFGRTTFEDELSNEDDIRVAEQHAYRHLRLVDLQTESNTDLHRQLLPEVKNRSVSQPKDAVR